MTARATVESVSDVAVGAMVYARRVGDQQAISESNKLLQLLEKAKYGIVIDCQAVEMGTSEVINVLLKLSRRAKKDRKHVALFNVPKTLMDTIKIASLDSVLTIRDDGIKAKQTIYALAGVKDPSAPANSSLAAAALFAIAAIGVLVVMSYLYLF